MYHALLSNRYLSTRVIPFIAIAAVGLCVALVVIVVSVMTGFLDMVKSSGQTLIGDVMISYAVEGLSYYDELIEDLEELPEVQAATPAIDTFGLIQMPYPHGPKKDTKPVQVWGIEPESFAAVTGYADAIYWKPLDDDADALDDDPRRNIAPDLFEDGRTLSTWNAEKQEREPGICLGIHVSVGNERQKDGSYRAAGDGFWFMPDHEVTLTLVPVDTSGGILDPESLKLPIVNEFMTGVFVIDESRVLIPLDIAQEMLEMDESTLVDPDTLEPVAVDPARVHTILVRAADGVTPEELKAVVEQAYLDFFDSFRGRPGIHPPPLSGQFSPSGVVVETWLDKQARFIGPIEKERALMSTLFQIVYFVCAGLVLSIFWSIVYEKTRDIGILRAAGASRAGICWIFLRYGLFVGVIGSIVGLGIATAVVHNINAIHDAMGNPPKWIAILFGIGSGAALLVTLANLRTKLLLPAVLGIFFTFTFAALAWGVWSAEGIVIWDPAVYYFSVIPNDVDFNIAWKTMGGAIFFCLLGAFIPAARAADIDPVRALRYE